MGLFRRAKSTRSSDEHVDDEVDLAADADADEAAQYDEAGQYDEEPYDDDTYDDDAYDDEPDGASDDAAAKRRAAVPASRAGGPWDITEMPDPGADARLDLGGVWVPTFEGLEVRVEADQQSGTVVSVTLVLQDSALQIQPFAAPRSSGIWSEVRTELAGSLTSQGGTADVVDGPFGPELRAKLPVRRPNGSAGVEAVRFIGVDGPRWFLRGALTGRAATEPGADEPLLGAFREVVVVRGSSPMAPREPIPLVLPHDVVRDEVGQEEETLSPFERGPEITEVR